MCVCVCVYLLNDFPRVECHTSQNIMTMCRYIKQRTQNESFKFTESDEVSSQLRKIWGCHRGVIVKAMDCKIVVSEFVLQSRNCVHFRANTLGKGMNPLILPAMG